MTPAEQLQVASLLLHLQLQHLLQQLLPQRFLHEPHPLQLLPVQPQQRAACGTERAERVTTFHLKSRPSPTCAGLKRRTCDGVVGEGLHVGQVVVRAVFLQPLTHILLRPQHHGPDQAGLSGAGVIYSVVVTGAALHRPTGRGGNTSSHLANESRVTPKHAHTGKCDAVRAQTASDSPRWTFL